MIHYSPANETDPKKAIYMGYSETTSFSLAKGDIPVPHVAGDKIYFYVQTFNDKGVGSTDIEKAEYLNSGQFLGSSWSAPVEVEVTTASTFAAPAALTKPTTANTVQEIKDYLDAVGTSYPSTATKAELLALV